MGHSNNDESNNRAELEARKVLYSFSICQDITTHLKRLNMKRLKLSSTSKVAGKKPCAFSLPIGKSCPGKTEACKDCYGCRGNHLYPSAQALDRNNFNVWRSFERSNDVNGAAAQLIDLVNSISINVFRVHERGDLRSQFGVKVWCKVIKSCPSKRFWLYTRSYWLDLRPLLALPNCRVWLSRDDFNSHFVDAVARRWHSLGIRVAHSMYTKAILPEHSIVCPALTGQIEHESACQACRFCFAPKPSLDVVFPLH